MIWIYAGLAVAASLVALAWGIKAVLWSFERVAAVEETV